MSSSSSSSPSLSIPSDLSSCSWEALRAHARSFGLDARGGADTLRLRISNFFSPPSPGLVLSSSDEETPTPPVQSVDPTQVLLERIAALERTMASQSESSRSGLLIYFLDTVTVLPLPTALQSPGRLAELGAHTKVLRAAADAFISSGLSKPSFLEVISPGLERYLFIMLSTSYPGSVGILDNNSGYLKVQARRIANSWADSLVDIDVNDRDSYMVHLLAKEIAVESAKKLHIVRKRHDPKPPRSDSAQRGRGNSQNQNRGGARGKGDGL